MNCRTKLAELASVRAHFLAARSQMNFLERCTKFKHEYDRFNNRIAIDETQFAFRNDVKLCSLSSSSRESRKGKVPTSASSSERVACPDLLPWLVCAEIVSRIAFNRARMLFLDRNRSWLKARRSRIVLVTCSLQQFETVDAEALYCMIRIFRPRRMIEIGSGWSTKVAAEVREAKGWFDSHGI
mgnify:CR=1 FL=1